MYVTTLMQYQMLVFIPVASLGRYFSFWALFPKSRMPLKPIDWWAPRVMPTPRSWLPTISTSRAYCRMDGYYHIRLTAQLCNTINIQNKYGPACLRGQGHPDQLAPADQRHPSPSGPPWFDPPPSLRHHSWQDHLPPVHKRQKHGGWGMSMKDIKQLWIRQSAKRSKTYLKIFADGSHKLSKKLLLLLIQGYSTDTWLHRSNLIQFYKDFQ